MICKKCGNEIKEEEIFCSKCGTKINDKSEPIRIKFTYFIIAIIAIIFIISIGILIYNNSNNEISAISSANQNTENIKEIENANKVLDVIDEEKQEFKINIHDLTNELKQIKMDEEIANREAFKSEFETTVQDAKDNFGNDVKSYAFCNSAGVKLNPYYVPPFIFGVNLDGNIFRIAVLHEYEADYGTNILSNSDYAYNWLHESLNNLGQNELTTTIEKARKKISDSINNKEKISSDFNINGVYLSAADAGTNKYGNSIGIYYIYGIK